jgi:AcrR family transcriptional regulator
MDDMPATRFSSRPPRKDAAENRNAIIHAAAICLHDDIDASLETIATEAGLSRRAIYGHFTTRDDLIIEMFTLGAERVETALHGIAHPDARVEIALYGGTLCAEVEHVRVLAQLAVRGAHRLRVAEVLAPTRTRLLATVRRGVADHTVRDDIPALTLSRLLEGGALAVLDEAVRDSLSRASGFRLVVLTTLGLLGLSSSQSAALVAATPELRTPRPAGPTLLDGSR